MKYSIIITFLLVSIPIIAGELSEYSSAFESSSFYDFPGWGRKQAITINSNLVKGSTDLTDFPVLITLDHLNEEVVDDGANSALNGGGDIRFSSDAAGNNRLAIEMVEFVTSATPANRRCQIWVKIPSLSTTTDTTIYIWYNKAGEVQPPANGPYGSQAVWNNYYFVSHDGYYDSATNQYLTVNGTPTMGTTSYGGKSWKGNGMTDYNALPDGGIDLSGNISISIWKKNTSTATNFGHSLSLSNSTGWIGLASHAADSNASRTFFTSEPQNEASGEGMRIFPSSDYLGWHYFSISETTLIGEGELMRGDGQAATLSPTTGFGWYRPTQQGNIVLGGKNGGDYLLHCELAEIRISQSIISPDFSDTDFNTMNSPGTFASAGIPEDVAQGGGSDTQAPTAPTLSSTGQTDTTADLSWNGATDNTAVTGYKVFKDGLLETTLGNVSTYQVTGLTASTAYAFTVTALDAAANESVASNSVNVTTNAAGGGGTSGNWTLSGSDIHYSTGNVGIGTTAQSTYKLAVNGKIHTREVKVDLIGWPDYVFKEGYDLPTLEEVEEHIKEKGHLINIPSAREVEANGIELGEMNKLLLEKIEELTLYVIDLKVEIELLKKDKQ